MLAPRTQELAEDRSGQFDLLAAALLGCVEPGASKLSVVGCAGFELGRLAGEGRGVSDPEIGAALWAAARVEVGAEFELYPTLRLATRLGVAIPLERREFVLDGQPVHRPAALTARGALGVDFLW
jgi:hypothetical protein